MKNLPNQNSAGLALDEEFVDRAMALRGGRDLDGAFLRALLEVGLETMALVVAASNEECGDPDCIGCRMESGEKPSPTMVTEFNAVFARMQETAMDRESGKQPERPVTIKVSESRLIFMVWLERLMRQHTSGGLRFYGPDIDMARPTDMESAGRYIAQTVVAVLEQELVGFMEGRHALLFPPRRKPVNGKALQ